MGLADLALDELARRLREGAVELAALLDALEERIARREPEIRALVEEPGRFERLRAEAAALAARYPEAASRPPLYGVPVGIKDIFHVGGFVTRAGSRLPPEELQGEEGPAVAALRAAGCLVLGKTVSTEFAFYAPGPTRNPRDPERTPGGSSSGSAAAVAAGFCPLALGTQTIGSISRPAAFCGVAGFKPTYDRISREGAIPLSPSLDHVGCFTVDAAGAALAAAVLCDGWRGAPTLTKPRPTLGVPAAAYLERAAPEALASFRLALDGLGGRGYRIVETRALADVAEIEVRHHRIVAAEAARVHRGWFERWGERYHAKTAELVERGRKVKEAELAKDLAGRATLRGELEDLRAAKGIDLWISPAAPGPAPRGLESTGDPVMNLPWTHAGVPTLALPAGAAEGGAPLGVQLAGAWQGDEELLAWGGIVEADLGPGGAR